MNKLIKMATIVAGIGAMLSFAGCGDSSNGEDAKKKVTEKLTPLQEFVANAREVGDLYKQANSKLGEEALKGMADEAEKLPAEEFKKIYSEWMPRYNNIKAYLMLAIKAKNLADDLENAYKVPTGRIRQLGFDKREIEEVLKFDSEKQLKAIEKMKVTIVELEKYKKQLQSLTK